MSRRGRVTAECGGCRLHPTLCVCDELPRIQTASRVVVMVHYLEARKPSNTGQLAARCLERGSALIYGRRERLAPPEIASDEVPLLLFPDPDAEPIGAYAGERVALLVPDGSWDRASRVRGTPGFGGIRCVTLPAAGPSEYRLRAEPRAGGLATLEAVARALAIVEGDPEIERAMLEVLRVMVERTLWFRGKLRDDEVAGGVPAAARAADPRGNQTRCAVSASGE